MRSFPKNMLNGDILHLWGRRIGSSARLLVPERMIMTVSHPPSHQQDKARYLEKTPNKLKQMFLKYKYEEELKY